MYGNTDDLTHHEGWAPYRGCRIESTVLGMVNMEQWIDYTA